MIFEHGNDFHNTIVFGPVIGHVTRREEWMETMRRYFADVSYARSSHAVDLFWGTKGGATGTVAKALPRIAGWLRALGILSVIATVGFLTFCLAVALTGVSLYPYLAAIAVAGLVLPWVGIYALRLNRYC